MIQPILQNRLFHLIVCWGKTHQESYYNKQCNRDVTFAVSDSGYMDDELGLLYLSQHFEPYTRLSSTSPDGTDPDGPSRACILIVDGHS